MLIRRDVYYMEETKVTRDTKEEILITALHRFARDGYEAVSVSQIAGDLGITKVHCTDIIRISGIYLIILSRGWNRVTVIRRKVMTCRRAIKRACRKSMKRYHWMTLCSTAGLCSSTGQRMILPLLSENCLW